MSILEHPQDIAVCRMVHVGIIVLSVVKEGCSRERYLLLLSVGCLQWKDLYRGRNLHNLMTFPPHYTDSSYPLDPHVRYYYEQPYRISISRIIITPIVKKVATSNSAAIYNAEIGECYTHHDRNQICGEKHGKCHLEWYHRMIAHGNRIPALKQFVQQQNGSRGYQ